MNDLPMSEDYEGPELAMAEHWRAQGEPEAEIARRIGLDRRIGLGCWALRPDLALLKNNQPKSNDANQTRREP